MNYEKAYKEALERAKAVKETYHNLGNISAIAVLESIFPELKSEDERIKRCIGMCLTDATEQRFEDFNTTLKDCLAWLEKQGEQKPTPKFKIGDIIHKIGENTVFPMTIEKIEDGDYVCNNRHSFVNIKFQDDYELVEQKPTGSEEDEKMRSAILQDLVNIKTTYPKINLQEEIDWLKSIKPNHWKPSEEQMEALNAINNIGELSYVEQTDLLIKLYNDLEKL